MFIPPATAREAALDAIEAGVGLLVVLTEHIPAGDVMAVHAAAARAGTRIVGPNTAGLVTPGEASVGIMPGHNANIFRPGTVGVISRSGSLGTLICLNLTRGGLGQSAFLGIGGDPMIGTTIRDALRALDEDARTQAVVVVGEIGGAMEEEAAEYAAGMTKPVVGFIAGRASPKGKKMGHAGAIVTGDRGSYDSKRRALESAGAVVVDTPSEVVAALRSAGEQRRRA
jgi:succinyl-CoA synthetase alpha subunit